MSMEFLALSVIIFKFVGCRKGVFYTKSKHDDSLFVGILNVNLLIFHLKFKVKKIPSHLEVEKYKEPLCFVSAVLL
jgi:hypothetical protein